MAGEAWSCKILNALYNDSITKEIVIAGGFNGIIRKVKIF